MEYFLFKMRQTLRTSTGDWYKLKKLDQYLWNFLSFVSQEEYRIMKKNLITLSKGTHKERLTL